MSNIIVCLLGVGAHSVQKAWLLADAPIAYGPRDDIESGKLKHGAMFGSWTNSALGVCLVLECKTGAECIWDFEVEFPRLNFRTIKECPYSGLTLV